MAASPPPQRDAYEIVLAAQAAALAAVRPGSSWDAPHEAAVKVLAQGMIDLGLLPGSVDGRHRIGRLQAFLHAPHRPLARTGRARCRRIQGATRHGGRLQPGMTLTVEPGLYIRPADDVPEALWNIGIRIEDDVLVTADGCEVLTAAARKQIGDIEEWMAEQHGAD